MKNIIKITAILSILFHIFIACENQQFESNILNKLESTENCFLEAKDSISITPFYLTPTEKAMEWWKTKDGTLSPVYEISVYMSSHPQGTGPDTCVSYYSMAWSSSIDRYNWHKYNRMQIQYRRANRITYQPWYNLGDEGPGNYNYGMVTVTDQGYTDLNAAHLPYGNIQVRYRLVHNDFPGTIDTNKDENNWYDRSLVTEWNIHDIDRIKVKDNKYGFDAPFDTISYDRKLIFYISVTKYQTQRISYSILIDLDGYEKSISEQRDGEYIATLPKMKKKGKYLITAIARTNNKEYTSSRSGIYDEPDTKIFIGFTNSDFNNFN